MKCQNTCPAKSKNRQYGFTLIELMIALLLGVLVIIAVSSVFVSGRRTYGTTQGLNRIQENQRMAFEMMAADIRSAGSYACPGLTDPVWLVGNNGTALDLPETRYMLAVGLEGNSPLVSNAGAQHEAGFDSITLAMDSAIGAIATGAERQYYPIKEHKTPTATSIELLAGTPPSQLHRSVPNYLVACNIDVAIVFATNSNLAGATIPVELGTGLCGGGFTRTPQGSLSCSSTDSPTKGYCFWGELNSKPNDAEKQVCGEYATSQSFVVNLADYTPASTFSNAWYVDDRKGKGALVNSARGGIVAEGVTGLELRYRLRGSDRYVTAEDIQTLGASSAFDFKKRRGVGEGISPAISHTFSSKWSEVETVYLKMKFKAPDEIVKGTDGQLLERTMETYITVRSHKLEY